MATGELIIQYKLKHPEPQEQEIEFIDNFTRKYNLQEGLKSGLFTKARRKHAKARKLRKLTKMKLRSQLALLKLDKKLSKREVKKLIRKLNAAHYNDRDYEIEAVYPNLLYEISSETNDPLQINQWSHDLLNPEATWEITKGEGITVAVIDTGVDHQHQDLVANIWSNEDEIAANGIDDDGNGYVDDIRGWDFVATTGLSCFPGEDCGRADNNPTDFDGHGTHVAGIIGATQNNEIGISGIAPEVKIMPLRAGFSTGSSAFLKTSDILDSIAYAINNDADVINMSFAGGGLGVLHDIIKLADSLDIVMVAAAGNNSTSSKMYPAAFPEVISVGAIADNLTKMSFSNYGDWVDMVAPGSWVFSTVPNNKYDYQSGTSMAAPLVAGVAALIKAKNKVNPISADEVKERLFASSQETKFRRYRDHGETVEGLSAAIEFPLEVDDILMPNTTVIGEEVEISAAISDPAVVDYEWTSDIDGFLGSDQTVVVDDLSEGSHVISVRAQALDGKWSEPVFRVMNVSPSKQLNPANFDDINFKIARRGRSLRANLGGRKNRKKIQAYRWVSNIDGVISERRKLRVAGLSSGYHKISLVLQDQAGNWSEARQKVIKL
ncbi:MAG: S8 family serine peptidase [Candidatus Melainabacteria bacterium]|nr:S8 family serine peptidase [Candidatus Melainabacteria bacterium]